MNHFILRCFVITCLILIATVVLSPFDTAAQIKLAWDPLNDPSVIGYKVYYGTATRTYGTPIDVGNVAIYTLDALTPGVTYYIAVTAYKYNMKYESGYSNEVSGTITETVGTPNVLGGPVSGIMGTPYSYTAGGSSSSLGNPVEYQFDWNGDSSDLSNWGSETQSKIWTTAGVYNVRARARSAPNASVMSGWLNPLIVSISVPKISVTPIAYDFENVKMKRIKTASFMVQNSGTANLSILTSTIAGADVSMFRITSGIGRKTIKPGKTLTIRVAFKPTSKGSKSANLEMASNDPDAPGIDIPLSGTGQ